MLYVGILLSGRCGFPPMIRRTVIAALLLATQPAYTHGLYDILCCADNDCSPIADAMVHETGETIIVRVLPGSHPMWPKEKAAALMLEFERSKLRKPIDGNWHVCISPSAAPLCLYPPQRGF